MNTSQLLQRNHWDLLLSLITLICLLVNWQMEISSSFEWMWIGILMALTGIPHGATDHLVHWHKQEAEGVKVSWKGFLIPYLLQMLIYAILWVFFPVFSFLAFLGISFYHFGQSELYYIQASEGNILKKMSYVLWGALILCAILMSQPEDTLPYLQEILPQKWLSLSLWIDLYPILMIGLSIAVCISWVTFWVLGQMSTWDLLKEALMGGLLVITLHVASLWISFGLYFGLWHATKAIRSEMLLIQAEKPNWALFDWIKEALPFSLISFLGLFLLVVLWQIWGQNWHPVFLFFVGISMLTLPHMTTLEHLYKNLT